MSGGSIKQACEDLRQGKVIAYPTEAVWGLGCDPFQQAAVEKILAIKKRPVEKGLLLVAGDMDQIQALTARLDAEQLATLRASWPGPVTWLIPDPDNLYPAWIKGQHSSVAIRVSAHPLVQSLCAEFGGPVVSTSANEAGEPEIRSRLRLIEQFAGSIDCVVDGELGGARSPSTIKDLSSGKTLR